MTSPRGADDHRTAVLGAARRVAAGLEPDVRAAMSSEGFDEALEECFGEAMSIVGEDGVNRFLDAVDRSALRADAPAGGPRTTLFALGLHGRLAGVRDLAADGAAVAGLGRAMEAAGVVAPGSRIVVSRRPMDALRLSELRPGATARLADAAHAILGGLWPLEARGAFEAAVDGALEWGPVVGDLLQDGVAAFGTRVVLGARRTASGAGDDFLDGFVDPRLALAGAAGSRLRVAVDVETVWARLANAIALERDVVADVPSTPTRARAHAAVFHVQGSLAALRAMTGLGQGEAPDELHILRDDDAREVVIVARHGDLVLGPVEVAVELAYAEVDTFGEALEAMVGDLGQVFGHDDPGTLPEPTHGMPTLRS